MPTPKASKAYDPFEQRQHEMPGDYAARPVTLPEGTFELTLNNYSAFVDATEAVSWMPSFAFGITSSFEVGLSAPMRYNETLQAWTNLDPLVHLSQKWLDQAKVEAALRIAVLIPAASRSDVHFEFGVPLVWHAAPVVRFDAGVNAVVAFESQKQAALNVPLGFTLQPDGWIYAGLLGTPNIGLSQGRDLGFDAAARLGFTVQTGRSAQADLTATLFAENVGTGRGKQVTDGIGAVISAIFYPEIY